MSIDIYKKYNIDKFKLKRDYNKNPLKKDSRGHFVDDITYDELYYVYIIKNVPLKDCYKIFNVSDIAFQRFLKRNKIKKDISKIYKNIKVAAKEKYGVENVFQCKKIIKKINTKKNQTLKKIGVNNVFQLENVKEKSKQTNLRKYGKRQYSLTDECKTRIKKKLKIYFNTDEYKKHIPIRVKKGILTKKLNKTLGQSSSTGEIKWLNKIGIPKGKKYRQVALTINDKNYIVDGFNPKTNTIYEYLGDYWHGNPSKYKSNVLNKVTGKTMGELYNQTMDRIKVLKESGYNVIYIWENDYMASIKENK